MKILGHIRTDATNVINYYIRFQVVGKEFYLGIDKNRFCIVEMAKGKTPTINYFDDQKDARIELINILHNELTEKELTK